MNRNTVITMLQDTDRVVELLKDMFSGFYGHEPALVKALPGAGSDRSYYRLWSDEFTVVGAHNPDSVDHQAFVFLSRHFKAKNFPVPSILASDHENGIYLIEDLGDETLLNWIENNGSRPDFYGELTRLYHSVINDLVVFQIDGDAGLDYSNLPVHDFDAVSMQWDLNYFKYYFLKPAGIKFNETALEKDFNCLAGYLLQEKVKAFMYRDFQARNIMLHNQGLYYIDYQGGRKGPLQYDLVSLLFQAKAAVPDPIKQELIGYYIVKLSERISFDQEAFSRRFNGFVLLRLLQVMGAYGFRGWFERKPHFLESIPLLKSNIRWLFSYDAFHPGLDELKRIMGLIMEKIETNSLLPQSQLTVSVNSFSYRRGIPYDPSGHGGGFVFDCRLLPNPGRLEEFRMLTGKDQQIIAYLENEPEVNSFVKNAETLVSQSVESYIKAGYQNLQVNFGCTGGRHRSVYCAEKLAARMQKDKRLKVLLKHLEFQNL